MNQALVSGAWGRRPESTPEIVAHRGGSYLAQENTLRAFDLSYMQGFRYLECDLRQLSGGGVCLMHDSTIDRTCAGTGAVSAFTTATINSQSVDSLTTYSPNHATEPIPLFSDLLDWAQNKDVILVPELKDNVSAAVLCELQKREFPTKRIIFQTFTLGWAADLIAGGYQCIFMSSALTDSNIASAAAAGFTHVGTQSTVWTGPLVAAAHAAGMACWAYTVNRRVDYAAMRAIGIDYVYTDDPIYLYWGDAGKRLQKQGFSGGMWAPGMLPATVAEAEHQRRGGLIAPYLQQDDITGYTATLIGHMCPLPNSFTLSGTLQFSAGSTSWASVHCCEPDDRAYIDGSATAGGYHILFRQATGNISLYRTTQGVAGATLLATGNGVGAVSTGVDIAWSITVDAAGLSIVFGSTTLAHANTERRGGYFHLGRTSGCGAKWGALSAA